jgi:hypothetical protein
VLLILLIVMTALIKHHHVAIVLLVIVIDLFITLFGLLVIFRFNVLDCLSIGLLLRVLKVSFAHGWGGLVSYGTLRLLYT